LRRAGIDIAALAKRVLGGLVLPQRKEHFAQSRPVRRSPRLELGCAPKALWRGRRSSRRDESLLSLTHAAALCGCPRAFDSA
jgi:hypothetical protein